LWLHWGARGPRDWPVPPNSSIWKSFIQRFSDCVAPCGGTPSCWSACSPFSPRATSLLLNNWLCLPALRYKHCLLLRGNCHYVRQPCTFQQRYHRQSNQLTRTVFSVLSNNALLFPTSLKLCDLCKFEMWWTIYAHSLCSRAKKTRRTHIHLRINTNRCCCVVCSCGIRALSVKLLSEFACAVAPYLKVYFLLQASWKVCRM
jgi:hypothetical protein